MPKPTSATLECISIWLSRRDLELLRALHGGDKGGYSLHIRGAVSALCEAKRTELAEHPQWRPILHRMGQLPSEIPTAGIPDPSP